MATLPRSCPTSGDVPVNVMESTSKLGWLLGVYLQDEWKLTPS